MDSPPQENPGKKSQPCPPNHHQPPTSKAWAVPRCCCPVLPQLQSQEWRGDVVMSWCRVVVESVRPSWKPQALPHQLLASSVSGTKLPRYQICRQWFWKRGTLKKKFPPNSCRMYRCVTSKARCIFNSDSKLESTNPILTTKQFTPGSGKKTRRVSLRSRTKLWSAAWKNPVSWLGWASPLVVASESPRQWKAPLLVSTGMPGNGGSLGEFIYLGSRVTTFDCKWSNAALKWKQSNSAMFHGSWRRDLSCLFASVSLVTFKATWESLVSRYPNASGLSLFCSALPDFGPSNKSSNKGLRSILTFDGLETALKRPDNKHPTTGWVA